MPKRQPMVPLEIGRNVTYRLACGSLLTIHRNGEAQLDNTELGDFLVNIGSRWRDAIGKAT